MLLKYFSYLLIIIFVTYFLGCEVQQASYHDTGIGGILRDSSTKKGIPGVAVTVNPLNYSGFTDSAGYFYIGKIGVPSSAGNYYITCAKEGYDTLKFFAILYAGDTTLRVNFAMYNSITNSVFVANDLIVSEYLTLNSLSALNLYALNVTSDSVWYNVDAILLDSSNTKNNFTFRAGSYAQPNTGWDTRFTNLLGNYTQYEFDTLSRIDIGPRAIDPYIDFPSQTTLSFNAPLIQNSVYGFYLLGRYDYGVRPRVYGLLRIDNFYFDNLSNSYKAVIDLKINKIEQNYFLLK
jgi:hypothetical protein